MSDLVEFLKARLDEDELDARAAIGGPWLLTFGERDGIWRIDGRNDPHSVARIEEVGGGDRTPQHIARHDPARVLRDVTAKRRIITEFEESGRSLGAVPYPDGWNVGRHEGLETALRLIALPYADHEAYPTE